MKNIFRRKIIKGGIDFISSSYLSGWVYSEKFKIKSIRLYSEKKILTEKKLDILRKDINKKFLVQGKFGFEIDLYYEFLSKYNSKIQVKALLEGGREVKLTYINNRKYTDKYLRYCFSGSHLGMVGNIDTYDPQNNYLRGWAYNKSNNESKSSIVWLQCEGLSPIMLKCNKFRGDLGKDGIPNNCGFKLNLSSLPEYFFEKKIILTFDIEGRFMINSNNNDFNLKLSKIRKDSLSKVINEDIDSPFYEEIQNSSQELKSLWMETEKFRQYLENLETNLDIIESKKLVKNNKSLKKNIFKNFLKGS